MSESTRWYQVDGTCCGPVPNKSKPGTFRNFTKTDAEKLDPPADPSVTGVIGIKDKPNLDRWKIRQHLLSVKESDKLPAFLVETAPEAEKAFYQDVEQITQARMDLAPDAGSAMHLSMLQRLHNQDYDPAHAPFIAELVRKLTGIAPLDTWDCERSFHYAGYHGLGYGGTADLPNHAFEHLADLKTQEFSDPKKVNVYDDWATQLAAYEMGLGLAPHGRRLNIIASRSTPGLVVVREWSEAEMEAAREEWKLLLRLWWITNRPERYFTAMNGGTE